MPVPDFSPGEVLTAAAMDSIGLWKIGGGTLSGTAVNFQGVFTSDYNVYKMFFYNVRNTTSSAELGLRLLSGSTPASGATDYSVQRHGAQGTSIFGNRTAISSARASFLFGVANALTSIEITIYGPNLPQRTNFQATANYLDNSPGANVENNNSQHNQSTAYDGIQVICTDTIFSGTVQIFGIRV
jgi:hypothetical protein